MLVCCGEDRAWGDYVRMPSHGVMSVSSCPFSSLIQSVLVLLGDSAMVGW